MAKDLYAEEVIDPGDKASAFAKQIGYDSHRNSPAAIVVAHEPDNFRGPIGFVWHPGVMAEMAKTKVNLKTGEVEYWEVAEEIENDGAGGKPQFASLLGTAFGFSQMGWEIITMTADDFARSGRLPVVIDNDLNVKAITPQNLAIFEAMMTGYGQALAKAQLINITGEIAIMKHSITSFCDTGDSAELHLTWSASCLGLARRELLLDPKNRILPGMPIVGLHEHGYRCNGGTFFTNLLLQKFGTDITTMRQNEEAMQFVIRLVKPSISYARTITRALGWRPNGTFKPTKLTGHIRGIAHITGGGVWGKFGEMLPPGVGAKLNNMPDPPSVLRQAQEWAWNTDLHLPDLQAYSTFHGGCGMMIVCSDHNSAKELQREANMDGIHSSVVGMTTRDPTGEIIITSKFQEGEDLSSRELKE